MSFRRSGLDLIDGEPISDGPPPVTQHLLVSGTRRRDVIVNPDTLRAKPNLFIVGAMKSGTTSAFAYLANIPDVFAPAMKEPQHFSTDLHRHPHFLMTKTIHRFSDLEVVRDRTAYENMFRTAATGTRYRMDASTSYLYSAEAPANISRYNPDSRIVILLRDPVVRAWSEYRMNRAIGIETDDFATALKRERLRLDSGRPFLLKRYVHAGFYSAQVKRYLELFPRRNVFIDLIDRPGEGLEPVLNRLTEFLGLRVTGITRSIRENEARVPANPRINTVLYYSGLKAFVSSVVPQGFKKQAKQSYYHQASIAVMTRADRNCLASVFEDSNRKLGALTDLDIGHWCGSS